MGIFSKIFGKEPIDPPLDIAPTALMMDEETFWELIQTSIEQSGGDQECQINILVLELERKKPAEIVGFRLRTDKLLYDTYNSKIWCAGYTMNGGCSDDGFKYFRLWIISKGRNVFEAAKIDPDSLVTQDEDEIEFYEFEAFWYVALTAFNNLMGKNLYDYIDHDNFKFGEGNYPQFEFDWSEDDTESRKSLCPRLFERFENK